MLTVTCSDYDIKNSKNRIKVIATVTKLPQPLTPLQSLLLLLPPSPALLLTQTQAKEDDVCTGGGNNVTQEIVRRKVIS